jgi:hypothetical protein
MARVRKDRGRGHGQPGMNREAGSDVRRHPIDPETEKALKERTIDRGDVAYVEGWENLDANVLRHSGERKNR